MYYINTIDYLLYIWGLSRYYRESICQNVFVNRSRLYCQGTLIRGGEMTPCLVITMNGRLVMDRPKCSMEVTSERPGAK